MPVDVTVAAVCLGAARPEDSSLDQALLMLIPKRVDAAGLGDYRPISLIHLVAKIFAKVLSLRLAPKLNELVKVQLSLGGFGNS